MKDSAGIADVLTALEKNPLRLFALSHWDNNSGERLFNASGHNAIHGNAAKGTTIHACKNRSVRHSRKIIGSNIAVMQIIAGAIMPFDINAMPMPVPIAAPP